VLGEAITQIPKPYRRKLLVTSDAAGASHGLIDWLVRQNHAADRCVEFSVGFDVDADARAAITAVRADCWVRPDAGGVVISAYRGKRGARRP
jgi:hypothetical protein